jgi:hypothetical protein
VFGWLVLSYLNLTNSFHHYAIIKIKLRRMVSSGMLHLVAVVRTDVSEELSASFIRVTRIGELGTTVAVTSNQCMLQRNTTRATRHNIPEDTILHSHRHENLKSYKDKIKIYNGALCGGFP